MYFDVFTDLYSVSTQNGSFGHGLAATSLGDYEIWAYYITLRYVSVLLCNCWFFFLLKFYHIYFARLEFF